MKEKNSFTSVHMVVKGLVQGVSYRYNTREVALKMSLVGTVSNMNDGSVEIYAEGDKEMIERFIAWCKKGPRYARVDSVNVEWLEFEDSFVDFKII